MALRAHTSLFALALVGLLSACGGGGGDGGGNGGGSSSTTPVSGSDMTTLQNQLGITAGTDKTMRAAITTGGHTNGTVRVDANPARMTSQVGDYVTPFVTENTPTTVVMDGEVSRVNGIGSVYYMPRTGSDMHVGMVHRSNSEVGVAGVFGNESGSRVMGARAATGGTATYTGQAEYTQDHGVQASGYRGAITANADFGTGGLDYGTGTMTRTTDTGGADSMRLSGSGVFDGNGQITGTYTTSPSTGTGSSGTTQGSLYGPTGQNIGMVFSGNGGAGAAILKEADRPN